MIQPLSPVYCCFFHRKSNITLPLNFSFFFNVTEKSKSQSLVLKLVKNYQPCWAWTHFMPYTKYSWISIQLVLGNLKLVFSYKLDTWRFMLFPHQSGLLSGLTFYQLTRLTSRTDKSIGVYWLWSNFLRHKFRWSDSLNSHSMWSCIFQWHYVTLRQQVTFHDTLS